MLRLLPALLLAATLAGCNIDLRICAGDRVCVDNGGERVTGSGTVGTQVRPVERFTAIRLEGSGRVIIERGEAESLTVTTDDNLLPLMTTEVRDGVLYLSVAKGKNISASQIVYRITVTDLRMISVNGSGSIDATKLEGTLLSLVISGSANVRLTGNVENLKIDISGSAKVNATELRSVRANVVVSGSGDVSVHPSDELDVRISGSATVSYLGSPNLRSKISGSGSIRPRPAV